MQKIRSLSLLLLIALIIYVLLDASGIVSEFNNALRGDNGWKRQGLNFTKTQMIYYTKISYSVMKDPKLKKGIRIMEGAIKKAALDRMAYLKGADYEYKGFKDESNLEEDLKFICRYFGGNTLIINGRAKRSEVKVTGFGVRGL